jgi:ADP-ribosyl-[dinitrogen reductase] hydrolase
VVWTSQTHPLRIDKVAAGNAGGTIGITFCPGKRDYARARDLEADLDVIAAWKPAAMLTLIEEHEFALLNVSKIGQRAQARDINWRHMPIVDVEPPDERFEHIWESAGPSLRDALRVGERVLVHCRGGLGRAGTVAALLLVDQGVAAAEAIKRVRAARPGAIQTDEQEQYVLDNFKSIHFRGP